MLVDFVHHNTEKIIFGRGAEDGVAAEVAACGGTRVLLHFDAGGFILPLIARIRACLEAEGIEVFELGGVVPNPKLSLMKEGCELVRAHDIDFVLAVGGGSTMDSAKYIACGTYYDGDIWNHPGFAPIASRVLPHGVVVTMPGTGSDVSTAAVWRDDTVDPERKTCVFAREMRFDFAIIDPELTFTLPPFQTAAGCFDIMSHAMEDYFCVPDDAEFILSAYEGVINQVMVSVKQALANPSDYTARANICRVAYVPLDDSLSSGVARGYCVHNLEKPMTGTFHRTHGEMLAILFPSWMRYCMYMNLPLFTRLAVRCFGAKMDYAHPEATVEEGVANLERFIADIGLPTRLSQVGIGEDSFGPMADLAIEQSVNDYIGRGIKLYRDDIVKVYELAR